MVLTRNERRTSKKALGIGISVVLVLVAIMAGIVLQRTFTDPLRTLEVFPAEDYMANHSALVGARFRADLTVENELGYEEGVGRLMLFTTPSDVRPFAVMIPAGVLNGIYFAKGQTYRAELHVKKGGLIHAVSLQKN